MITDEKMEQSLALISSFGTRAGKWMAKMPKPLATNQFSEFLILPHRFIENKSCIKNKFFDHSMMLPLKSEASFKRFKNLCVYVVKIKLINS